jgi:hypothetical protein
MAVLNHNQYTSMQSHYSRHSLYCGDLICVLPESLWWPISIGICPSLVINLAITVGCNFCCVITWLFLIGFGWLTFRVSKTRFCAFHSHCVPQGVVGDSEILGLNLRYDANLEKSFRSRASTNALCFQLWWVCLWVKVIGTRVGFFKS